MVDNIEGGFSLADLADLDVSDIEEVRFTNLPAGIFGWEIKESELKEYEKDGDTKYKAEIELEVIEVKAIVPTPGEEKPTPESLIGKRHIERLVVDPAAPPEEVQKALGRIRAWVSDVGMDSSGKLGEIVKNLKGHTFVAKGSRRPDKIDKTQSWFRLNLEPAKK